MATRAKTKRDVEDFSDHAAILVKDFHEVGDAAKRIATDGAQALRGTAQQYLDQGRTRARNVGDRVQGKVQDEPVKALLIAAGLGFLLGAFWIRR